MAFNHVFQLFPAEFFKNTGQKECLSFKTGAFELYFFLFRLELQAMDTQPVKERQVTRIPEEFQQTIGNAVADLGNSDRSEEHTSELQSLMRISYAVFCLKKKKTKRKLA